MDLIQQALDVGVKETATLEWKSQIPGSERANREEVAKDTAAQANSGGGLVIYGVREDGNGGAQTLTPVDIAESTVRRLLQIAGTIQPPVLGIQTLTMPESPGSEKGVLVLSIPGSSQASHFIARDENLRAPDRQGPQIAWMSEAQVERAYQERLQSRGSLATRLTERQQDFVDRVDLAKGPWHVAAAIPEVPLPLPGRLAKEDVKLILSQALSATKQWGDQSSVVIRSLADTSLRVVPGLQKWMVPTVAGMDWGEVSDHAHAEIHQDGSVSLGACTDEFINPRPDWSDRHAVEPDLVEQLSLEFVTPLTLVAEHRGVAGAYNVRVDFGREDDMSLALPGRDLVAARTGGVRGVAVRRFVPVTTTLVPHRGSVRRQAALLSLDVLNQFGVDALNRLPLPHEGSD